MNMLLNGKNAVLYGGGGKVGGAVARAFASEGAKVFLTGRTIATLDEVAGFIEQRSLLGRVTTLAEVVNAAAFLASDRAAAITGTVFNLTSGTVVD